MKQLERQLNFCRAIDNIRHDNIPVWEDCSTDLCEFPRLYLQDHAQELKIVLRLRYGVKLINHNLSFIVNQTIYDTLTIKNSQITETEEKAH